MDRLTTNLVTLFAIFSILICSCNLNENNNDIEIYNDGSTLNSKLLINDLKILYKSINPNDTIELNNELIEKYFQCKKIDTFGALAIVTVSYLVAFDGPISLAVIIKDLRPNRTNSTHYIWQEEDVANILNNDHKYQSYAIDSILNKIDYFKTVNRDARNKIISKVMLLLTVENIRLSKNGSSLNVGFHQSCADLIAIDSSSVKLLKTQLLNKNDLNLYYPSYDYWQREIAECCANDLDEYDYHELVKRIEGRMHSDSSLIQEFTNFSKALIIDSTYNYMVNRLSDPSVIFYYTVPDYQLFEIEIIDMADYKFRTSLKWLYPRLNWHKTYLPIIDNELYGNTKPILIE